MSTSANPIDLAFRPKTWLRPLALEKRLLTHITGTERGSTSPY